MKIVFLRNFVDELHWHRRGSGSVVNEVVGPPHTPCHSLAGPTEESVKKILPISCLKQFRSPKLGTGFATAAAAEPPGAVQA